VAAKSATQLVHPALSLFTLLLAFAFFTITIAAQTAPPPNDNWNNRITLQGTNFDFTGSTFGATFELGDPSPSNGGARILDPVTGAARDDQNAGSIFWSWTSPISGVAILSLPPVQNFVDFYRPQLVVFTDSPVDLNTEIAATLDVVPGFYKVFSINAGETYALALVANAATNISYTIHLDASQTPVILQQPQSQTVAAGNACFFTVVAPGYDTNKNVRWTHNGAEIPYANGPSLLIQNASAASAGEYRAYINILNPAAIAISEPATLTLEDRDIQPKLSIQRVASSTNDFTLQVLGETNQFYFLYYSTSFTFDSQIFAPAALYPFTHEPIPYHAHGALVPFQPVADLPLSFLRAERAGAQIQSCIVNLHRIEVAKETWRIYIHGTHGMVTSNAGFNAFLDGVDPTCPLGGFYNYNPIGTPPTCTLGHGQ
jgi:hypothetical protein